MTTHRQTSAARRANNRLGLLALLTMLPAVVVLGWRALLVTFGVVVVAGLAGRWLRGPRPKPRRWPVTLPADALLLAGLLPAELAGGTIGDGWHGRLWPLIPAAGLAIALLRRLREFAPWPPFDCVVVAALALHVLVGSPALSPRAALHRAAIVTGDVLRAERAADAVTPWFRRPSVEAAPALDVAWAAGRIDAYLSVDVAPADRATANLDSLIRDRLPPLEDLLLLGHPMPIGMTSGIVLIGAILWGAHRRTIDYRVPLVAIASAYVALVVLPVPTSVGERGASWRLFASLHADVGPATALTFAHYVLFASPMLYCLGLLAPRGDLRPIQPRAVVAWSLLLGVTTAAAALYFSVTTGPLVVLLVAPTVGRWLDRALARRPLAVPH